MTITNERLEQTIERVAGWSFTIDGTRISPLEIAAMARELLALRRVADAARGMLTWWDDDTMGEEPVERLRTALAEVPR
jgi:hypothetical protein